MTWLKMASILLLALLESTASQLTCEITPCVELEETADCPFGYWNFQKCCICWNSCGLKDGTTRPQPLSPARLLPLHIYCHAPAFADTLTRRRPGPEYTRFN